ncbi:hypothetical protein ACM25N_16485 [Roseovarius sp. C7]|uniref:hypothetical protein n=1 Tax=Roseovarius sp. C7 TaxID=3398643 RepID=UPI0039F70E71
MQLDMMAGHLIRRMHQRSTYLFQRMAQAEGQDITQVQYAALEAVLAHPGVIRRRSHSSLHMIAPRLAG